MNKFHLTMYDLIKQKFFSNTPKPDAIDKFVSLLEESNYKVIASDFDNTMIELHSGGYVDPSADVDILSSITEDFKLMCKRLKNSNIILNVVTFSDPLHVKGHQKYISGDDMVRRSLICSNCDADIKRVYAYYPRFWETPNMYKKLNLSDPMPRHKEYHLRRICEDFNVELKDIILIDDDIYNCRNANSIGATAIYVTGDGFKIDEIALL